MKLISLVYELPRRLLILPLRKSWMSEARAAAFATHAAARDAEHARCAAAYAIIAATSASDTDATTEHDWQYQRLAKHLQTVMFPD